MFRFAPYLIKSLSRHRARTLLTVSGAAVALFVFCFVGSVQQGLEQLTGDEASRRTLIVFQENRFCPSSSRLPLDYADRIRKVPGVQGVMPVQVWTNNCRASLDVIVFNGVPADSLKAARDLQLAEGNWSDFLSRRDAALVGQNVALRRNLSVGDLFSIGGISVTVAGVFESPSAPEENLIYTDLQFLQFTEGLDAAGTVTQFEVSLADESDADAVARSIDEALRSGPVATTTRRKGAFQASTLSDLVDLIGFTHWLGFACVGLVLSLVATTTVMSVQDRVGEHAILQTLGLRPGGIFRLIVVESLLMCATGGLIGTGLALAILSSSGLAVGAEGATISFEPSWQLAVSGVAVSIVVGALAGVVPAWQAARAHIVSALRQA